MNDSQTHHASSRPRLLFIGALPEPITGQSLACQVLHDELIRHYAVDVINMSKSGFKQGVDSFRRVLEILRVLWQSWRRRHADVLYLTISESRAGNLKDVCLYLLCYRQLPRMFVHLHGGAGLRTILRGPRGIIRRLNERLLSRLGGVIVLGPRHVDMFADCVPPDRIHIVANFAEEFLFTDAQTIDRKFAARQPMRILFLSNLIPGKGYLELLEAFAALEPAERQRFQLDFAGGFEDPAHQRQFLDRIATLPHIQYHGVVRGERKRALFADAHVFCLPTYYPYEGQPISILEAYASGCVVVTTDHSGIFDVFTPGTNGYEVAKQSAPDLARVLRTLLQDEAPLVEIAQNNFELARNQFKPAIYCRNVMKVFEQPARAVQ